MEHFSQRLESLIKPGESRAEFAERLGLSTRQFSIYLTGTKLPGMDIIQRIALNTSTSVEWLIFGEDAALRSRSSVKKEFSDKEIAELAAMWIKQARDLSANDKDTLVRMIRQIISDKALREELLVYFQYQEFKNGRRMMLEK